MFQASFHTIVTLRAFDYAPPDTGVSDLQLVAVEYLPSIEGAGRICRAAPFCGEVFFVCFAPCRGGALLRPLLLISSEARAEQSLAPAGCTLNGFPYEGKLSPEATDEVDCGA